MRVLEFTDERLRLLFIRWGLSATICDFDKQKNVVEIIHLLAFLPFKRDRIPFSEITSAELNKKKRNMLTEYRQVLRLRHGSRLSFASGGKEEALEATRMIRTFIGEQY